MKAKQIGFFDEENRYKKLTELGDPLEKLNSIMNWEVFRDDLTRVCQKEDYSKGGRPPIDVIVKFKASILKRIYNLSYDQTEYQINDRLMMLKKHLIHVMRQCIVGAYIIRITFLLGKFGMIQL